MATGIGKLVVVSGPSGAGKSTIVREALRRTGASFSVSATTRAPRAGEQNGREYWFVDRQKFQDLIRRDHLLEWAEVFGEFYGTPAGPVQEAIRDGRTIVLDIDVQGAVQVHRKMPDAQFVLIEPPCPEELARRLRRRGTEDEEALQRRLAKAQQEIEAARSSGAYNHTVVNDDLETAIRQVVRIVTEEHAKR